MLNVDGDPLIIPYLWALVFGNGDLSDADDLYFAAGIGDELRVCSAKSVPRRHPSRVPRR